MLIQDTKFLKEFCGFRCFSNKILKTKQGRCPNKISKKKTRKNIKSHAGCLHTYTGWAKGGINSDLDHISFKDEIVGYNGQA